MTKRHESALSVLRNGCDGMQSWELEELTEELEALAEEFKMMASDVKKTEDDEGSES